MQGIPRVGTALSHTYLSFAQLEAAGNCAVYERLCTAIAADAGLLELLETLPMPKRQPNLLLAASRWLGAPVEDPAAFLAWTFANWARLAPVILSHSTQTNEPGRCRVLAPLLARLTQPLALLEVGASAGLCLYPDLFGGVDGLDVLWRAGIDLNPLDVNNNDDVRWLECLVWPSQPERLARLRAAVAAVREAPPIIHRGDLNATLDAVIAQAPPDATLVVFHTAVLAYVDQAGRDAFAQRMSRLDGHWISNEAVGVMHHHDTPKGMCLMALDGTPVAFTAPHGQALQWL